MIPEPKKLLPCPFCGDEPIPEPKKLLPCPFCGDEPRVYSFEADYSEYGGGKCRQFTVCCYGCGIASATDCGPGRMGNPEDDYDSDEAAFEAVLTAWNRRFDGGKDE